MYYPIRKKNVAPSENYGDAIRYFIRTSPAKTNSSREEKTSGWLGTTDDTSVHALGEYDTKEKAVEAIREDSPSGHVLLHSVDEWRGAEKWISRPDVSQEGVDLIEERKTQGAEILGGLMEDLNALYQEHGCPRRQYEGAPDTTTGGPARDSIYLAPGGLDPYGESPEWAGRIASKYNDEMGTIAAALDLSYPRYYTTPEWSAFKEEAIEMVEGHQAQGFEDALQWAEENDPAIV
jgi:hypothetical protein